MTAMKKSGKSNSVIGQKSGIFGFISRSMQDSSFAFYLAFTGVIIQFVHNLLAVATTFALFSPEAHPLLVVGEWILAFTIAFAFAATLFYFTIQAGTVEITSGITEEEKQEKRGQRKKYNRIIGMFVGFDTLIDFYFWVLIVFIGGNVDNMTSGRILSEVQEGWPLLIVIIPVTVMLPLTLQFYTREIKIKKEEKL